MLNQFFGVDFLFSQALNVFPDIYIYIDIYFSANFVILHFLRGDIWWLINETIIRKSWRRFRRDEKVKKLKKLLPNWDFETLGTVPSAFYLLVLGTLPILRINGLPFNGFWLANISRFVKSMSWGEYLQGGSGLMNHYQKIESCGIFGHNGSTWAQVGMDHTQQYYNEITDLVGLFTDPSSGIGFVYYVIVVT